MTDQGLLEVFWESVEVQSTGAIAGILEALQKVSDHARRDALKKAEEECQKIACMRKTSATTAGLCADAIAALIDQPAASDQPCPHCEGMGFVKDGVITGVGGCEFECGPIQSTKDCPHCGGSGKLTAKGSQPAADHFGGVTDMVSELPEDYTAAAYELAGMVMSDCGVSGLCERLRERVAKRITAAMEQAMQAHKAERLKIQYWKGIAASKFGDGRTVQQIEIEAVERAQGADAKNAARWVNPNRKQGQFLPQIGEPVLFCCDGVTYYGKHTGGSFKTGSGITSRDFNTWRCHWMYLPKAIDAAMQGKE